MKMQFCPYCGTKLDEGARFCKNCGEAVLEVSGETDNREKTQFTTDNMSGRKTVYEGSIHKCPNCGEVITPFLSVCPSCGLELRGSEAVKSIKDFCEKLEATSDDAQRITLIRNYPIPNTREDVLEFMILASTNICGNIEKCYFEAWKIKFEQCYHKSKLIFNGSTEIEKIQSIYDQTNKKIRNENLKRSAKYAMSILPKVIFRLIIIALAIITLICVIYGLYAVPGLLLIIVIISIGYFKKNQKNSDSSDKKSTGYTHNPKDGIKMVRVPLSIILQSVDNYMEVEALFVKAGFTNVVSVPLHDLALGLLQKNGSVDSIKINGIELNPFFIIRFRCDTPVVITYHSFR